MQGNQSSNGSDEDPHRNQVSWVLEAPDSQHKLDILVLDEMGLSFNHLLQYLKGRCVGHVEGKSVNIFVMMNFSFDSIPLLLQLSHSLFIDPPRPLVVESRFSSNNPVIYLEMLTERQ